MFHSQLILKYMISHLNMSKEHREIKILYLNVAASYNVPPGFYFWKITGEVGVLKHDAKLPAV